jgi:putative hemolysin
MFIEIGIVCLLVVVNGLLAMSELAIVSSRLSRLKALVDRGVHGSRRALTLASNPGKFLSTVQIGITLVGILSGAFSGATLGNRLALWLEARGVPDDFADAFGVGSVVVLITYGSLIIGELVPKQIALRNPEAVALRVAPAMAIVAKIMSPLVFLLDLSGRLVLSLLGQRGVSENKVTEEEIKTLIAEADTSGVLDPGEKEMIAGVLRLGDRNVQAVMTPRNEVDMINVSESMDDIRTALHETPHSRLPAYDDNPDEVIGVLQAKDILNLMITGGDVNIRSIVRQAPIIPETADAHDVISILKTSPIHMALVHDEYGHFIGVVTSGDILESIVGTFLTEEGPAEAAAVRREDGSYLLSGWMPVDDFGDLTGLMLPEDRTYHTVAGFVIDGFGRLPDCGESFDTQGWRFEVIDLDGRRVDKVLATKIVTKRRVRIAA